MATTHYGPAGAVASATGNGLHPPAQSFWALTLGCIGVVYGDIGTSPLYAMREAVVAAVGANGEVTRSAVLGVLSLIIWSLIIVVTAKYVFILLRADNKGEGGTLSLMALAQRALGRPSGSILLLGITGAALFYGDAMITPAISVLSAVEGLKVATPAFDHYILPLTVAILAWPVRRAIARHRRGLRLLRAGDRDLVSGDRRGRASRTSFAFPACSLPSAPYHAIGFMLQHGLIGFVTLGAVFLAVTGRRGALCRSRPFRPETDSGRVARARLPGARAQLFRTGRAVARQSEGDRKSVLSAVSRNGRCCRWWCSPPPRP